MDCSFDSLIDLLEGELDLDRQLAVLTHLDDCEVCFDAIYQISRDRNSMLAQNKVVVS
jgi:hypothetical protein